MSLGPPTPVAEGGPKRSGWRKSTGAHGAVPLGPPRHADLRVAEKTVHNSFREALTAFEMPGPRLGGSPFLAFGGSALGPQVSR
jgi:hypothetical protein